MNNLLGNAMDKEFWVKVRENECYARIRDELHEMWRTTCEDQPIKALLYSDYKQFWVKGSRGEYEGPYFFRRTAMNACALLALIYPEEQKYLDRLMDQIFAICDEYSWCVPAHQRELEPNNNSRVDLFASETGFALAEIYTALGDRLDPLIRNRILAEVDRRIIKPLLAVDNYGWWENGTNNWAAVCMGSVACTVMLLYPDLYETFRPRIERTMDNYLSGFKDDGICEEGSGYWHYGFGFFVVYADMIRRFTDGKLDYFKREKVRTVATYIQKVFLSGNTGVSFADGGRSVQYHLGLVHYLKKEYPDEVLVYDPKYAYFSDGCARWCLHIRSILWLDEEVYLHPDVCAERDYYAPETQWLMRRTAAYGFAAKAGHNNEMHNHNDVGSFIFAKNGRQVLMDIGAGIYSKDYFSGKRYTILECCSRGHSVPIVNGTYQKTGMEAHADSVSFENGIFKMDIAGAYDCAELKKLERAFSFTLDSVSLTDTITRDKECEITERIVTLFEPVLEAPGRFRVEDVTVEYDTASCEAEITTETRLNGQICYMMDFHMKPDADVFRCTFY